MASPKETKKETCSAEDLSVIDRVCGGNVNEFAVLVEKYKSYVASITAKHVPREAVPEVTHEVFISAYSSLSTFSRDSAFRHWLAALAVRRAYDYWRRAYRTREVPTSQLRPAHQEWLENSAAGKAAGEHAAQEWIRDGREVLGLALRELSPADRMLVTLVYFDGCELNEAAALLGWSKANVKVRVFRLRTKLRSIINSLLEA
ncbi:MAG TPA: sigma-70 family RNA polymerase sigma factor [Oligoflexia bacterium]|nr:sigma-70 family RNA polymerase sigma factor [Oligoflexia bacterium]